MILEFLQPDDETAAQPALVDSENTLSWSLFASEVATRAAHQRNLNGQRVGLQLSTDNDSLVSLFALLEADVHVFLMSATAAKQDVAEWANDFGLAEVLDPRGKKRQIRSTSPRSGKRGGITILTSGTTGKPKAAEHSWQGLTRPVRRTVAAHGDRWLLTFRPHLYAGLQVIMQCLLNYGTLVMPPLEATADAVVDLAATSKIEFASATPSYWRWLLTFAGDRLRELPLQQITLGGEAVDQPTLDALRSKFPSARLVHIYATTELGRCFSVTDGRAGFPAKFLEQISPDGVEMRIESNELVVRSANAMVAYDQKDATSSSDWFHTGDVVELEGDRVYFVGRLSDMINVGGNKVYPLEIEKLVRSVPGVQDTRIYGEASSMVGELVRCDVVVQEGFDPQSVETEIRKRSLDQLANYQRPRFISIVSEIPRTAAGKVKRS